MWGCHYFAYLIAGVVEGELRADGREVLEAGFFALDELPEPVLEDSLKRTPAGPPSTPGSITWLWR